MDSRFIRHPFVPPLLIGILSLLGICVILGSTWLPRQEPEPVPSQTVTPFKYLLLATETAFPTQRPETATARSTSTEISPFLTGTFEENSTLLPVGTGQAGIYTVRTSEVGTPEAGISESEISTPTPAITIDPVFARAAPLTAGTHDAASPQIIRSGDWVTQNSEGAFGGSLLVSRKTGNSLTFSFVGYRIALGFQGSDTGGDLKISIDGSEEILAEELGAEWFSQELESTMHYVVLTHESGAMINLDFIIVIE